MNFYDKFALKCNEKQIAPSAAVVEMGFHKSELTRWKKGTTPRRANLLKMAKYFNCDVRELEGDEENKGPLFAAALRDPVIDEANRIIAESAYRDAKEKPAPSEGDGMDEIIQIFNELEPSRRSKLLELARLYLDDQRRSARSE